MFGDEKYEVKAITDMTEESTWLNEVYIPNTVTTIGYSCFSNCDELKKVHISNTFQDFADYYGDDRTEAPGYLEYQRRNPSGWLYEITVRNSASHATPSDVMSEVPVRSVKLDMSPIAYGLYALNYEQ